MSSFSCIVRMAVLSTRSATSGAASMAWTFAETNMALADVGWLSSARASCLAPTVRFSISEDEEDSVRNRIEDIGPSMGEDVPHRSRAWLSKRTNPETASPTSAASGAGTSSWRLAIFRGTADSYGPDPPASCARELIPPCSASH